VIAVDATVCATLTVPVHTPVVHGFGERVTIVVPKVTPVPEITIPIASLPDATAVVANVVDATAIEPVATPVAVPAGQYVPAGH
jgi:hypothetical protein